MLSANNETAHFIFIYLPLWAQKLISSCSGGVSMIHYNMRVLVWLVGASTLPSIACTTIPSASSMPTLMWVEGGYLDSGFSAHRHVHTPRA